MKDKLFVAIEDIHHFTVALNGNVNLRHEFSLDLHSINKVELSTATDLSAQRTYYRSRVFAIRLLTMNCFM